VVATSPDVWLCPLAWLVIPIKAAVLRRAEVVLEEGRQAGALATYLSGAGSSLLALVSGNGEGMATG